MAATTTARTRKSSADYLQDALKDLDKAREKAGKEVEANIDSARERINEASERLSERGHDQLDEWRTQLEDAAEDVRRELGRWAIRAQSSPQALSELSREITKRKAELAA